MFHLGTAQYAKLLNFFLRETLQSVQNKTHYTVKRKESGFNDSVIQTINTK